MFKIYDGRKEFFQWDLEQKLIVSDPTVNEVHFSHNVDSESLVCEVYELDGLRVVNVPNILLQEDWKINVYAYCSNYTKVSACFKVIPKAKPADYVYTETEVMSWQEYGERIAALEENGGGITEITEETFLADLPTGIYKINCQDDSYCLWIDDAYWYGLSVGIIMVSYDEVNQAFEWMFVGRDTNYTEGAQRGRTHWDTEWEYWACNIFGEIEYDNNKVSDLTEPRNVSSLKYPSTQAVVDYVDYAVSNIAGGGSVSTVEEWELIQESTDIELRSIEQTCDGTYSRYVILLEGRAATTNAVWRLCRNQANANTYLEATISTHAYGGGTWFFIELPKNGPALLSCSTSTVSGQGHGVLKQSYMNRYLASDFNKFILRPDNSDLEYISLSVKVWGVKA